MVSTLVTIIQQEQGKTTCFLFLFVLILILFCIESIVDNRVVTSLCRKAYGIIIIAMLCILVTM